MKSILKKLMTHTLTIRKRARDWQGSFSDTETFSGIRGFVQYGTKLVTNQKGEEVTASAIIFLPDTTPIDPTYEHWMIDQVSPYSRENMEVIRIDPIDDPRTGKTHHYEVAVR
jgi:hypothetical protein